MGQSHLQSAGHPPTKFQWGAVHHPPTSQGLSASTRSRRSSQAQRGPRSSVDEVAGGDCEFGARRSRGEEGCRRSTEEGKITSVVPPVEDRIAQSMKFLERAKKRLAVANTELQSAVQKKSQCEQEVAEAEADLARMREDGRSRRRCVCRGPTIKGQIGSIGVDPRSSSTRVGGSSREHPFEGGKTASGMLCRRCVAINGARSQLLVGRKEGALQDALDMADMESAATITAQCPHLQRRTWSHEKRGGQMWIAWCPGWGGVPPRPFVDAVKRKSSSIQTSKW